MTENKPKLKPELEDAIKVLSVRMNDLVNQTNVTIGALIAENQRLTRENEASKTLQTPNNPTKCEVKKHAD